MGLMYEVTYPQRGARVAVHLYHIDENVMVNGRPLRIRHPLFGMTFSTEGAAETYLLSQGINADRLEILA